MVFVHVVEILIDEDLVPYIPHPHRALLASRHGTGERG
jgi:hypothetical protein